MTEYDIDASDMKFVNAPFNFYTYKTAAELLKLDQYDPSLRDKLIGPANSSNNPKVKEAAKQIHVPTD